MVIRAFRSVPAKKTVDKTPAVKDAVLVKAIKIAGGLRALGNHCGGISHAAVAQWRRCPPQHVIAVESLTGIPRQKLRPDLYPPEPKAKETSNGKGKIKRQSKR